MDFIELEVSSHKYYVLDADSSEPNEFFLTHLNIAEY
jgi:hypothetical protein